MLSSRVYRALPSSNSSFIPILGLRRSVGRFTDSKSHDLDLHTTLGWHWTKFRTNVRTHEHVCAYRGGLGKIQTIVPAGILFILSTISYSCMRNILLCVFTNAFSVSHIRILLTDWDQTKNEPWHYSVNCPLVARRKPHFRRVQ